MQSSIASMQCKLAAARGAAPKDGLALPGSTWTPFGFRGQLPPPPNNTTNHLP